MSAERIDTLVVGAGQAGVAMSEHLTEHGVSHVVLERSRIAERWRSARWDSLVANGPAWHDRFPGLEFDAHPDEFIPKEKVADYFVSYAQRFSAPIRCGVDVKRVRRLEGRPGFRVETSEGNFEASNVVAATGPFQCPSIPKIVPHEAGLNQIHSSDYRNPGELPDGAVLVVGAGSSGVQIADELLRAGRRVYLSVGPHDRPPRSYRGRDFVWWLGVLGKWDAQAPVPGTEHVTIAVSGARGGETIDFRRLASSGMTLLGLTKAYVAGTLTFEPDLVRNIERGDANYLALLDEADAFIARNGLSFPEEPEARQFILPPDCIVNPILDLDLRRDNVTTIVWATGFTTDYSWLQLDVFEQNGRPKHHRGVTDEPGIYFLGLPWLSGRGSSFIWGVWHDAKYLADHIVTQRKYLDYPATNSPQGRSRGHMGTEDVRAEMKSAR